MAAVCWSAAYAQEALPSRSLTIEGAYNPTVSKSEKIMPVPEKPVSDRKASAVTYLTDTNPLTGMKRNPMGAFAQKIPVRTLLAVASTLALLLIVVGMCVTDVRIAVPVFMGTSLVRETVPVTALLFVLCGLCTSVMWSSLFNLSVEGLGDATASASGWFMTMVVGGGILPLFPNHIADKAGFLVSYVVPCGVFAYLILYSLKLSKPR